MTVSLYDLSVANYLQALGGVEGFLAKDGTKGMANARRVVLPDGRRVFGGSSADTNANQ